MKWLLITTRGNLNPGDQFIRLGVMAVIEAVDPAPEYILISKESPDQYETPVEFDRCVLCGMPLWWSSEVGDCQDIYWWEPLLNGWPSARRRDFLVLGAGSATGLVLKHPERFAEAVQWVIDRAYGVTTRNIVMDHPGLIRSICPSAFAAYFGEKKTVKLCNLMPNGAHDAHFNEHEAALWRTMIPEVSKTLQGLGYVFCAHSVEEHFMATQELGWPEDRVFFAPTTDEYVELYATCSHYWGNRLHGALMAAASGGIAIAVGYDSRMRMLDRFSMVGQVHPSGVTPQSIVNFTNRRLPDVVDLQIVTDEFARSVAIMRDFAGLS